MTFAMEILVFCNVEGGFKVPSSITPSHAQTDAIGKAHDELNSVPENSSLVVIVCREYVISLKLLVLNFNYSHSLLHFPSRSFSAWCFFSKDADVSMRF